MFLKALELCGTTIIMLITIAIVMVTIDDVIIKAISEKKRVKKMETKRIDVSESKYYLEFDGIRIIVEYGDIIGWYHP